MPTYEIDYLLPVTAARFDVTFTSTHVSGSSAEREATADLSLVTQGDVRSPQCAKVTTGWIRDIDATLGLLPELRLSSASTESTGRLGELVAAGVKLVGTAAGARMLGETTGSVSPEVDTAADAAPPIGTIDDRIAALRARIGAVTAEIVDAVNEPGGDVRPRLKRLALLKTLRATAEEELGLAVSARQAILASATTRTRWTAMRTLPFDVLPETGSVIPADGAEGTGVVQPDLLGDVAGALWVEAGVVLTSSTEFGADGLLGTDVTAPGAPAEGVYYRIPRRVRWALWRSTGLAEDGTFETTANLMNGGVAWVVDTASALRFVEFRRSWWARRKSAIDFAADGTVSKIAVGASSSVAAAATALAAAPQGYSDALTTVKTIVTTNADLADQADKERLDDLKRTVEERESELKGEGLNATAGDYARLERLKQQVAIAEQQEKLAPGSPSATALARAELEAYLVDELSSRRGEAAGGSVGDIADLLDALRE